MDLANAFIRSGNEPVSHPLDNMASKSDEHTSSPRDAKIPIISRDPCLLEGEATKPLEYVDVFVDDFLALAQ